LNVNAYLDQTIVIKQSTSTSIANFEQCASADLLFHAGEKFRSNRQVPEVIGVDVLLYAETCFNLRADRSHISPASGLRFYLAHDLAHVPNTFGPG
jgi:hypothetical protein